MMFNIGHSIKKDIMNDLHYWLCDLNGNDQRVFWASIVPQTSEKIPEAWNPVAFIDASSKQINGIQGSQLGEWWRYLKAHYNLPD